MLAKKTDHDIGIATLLAMPRALEKPIAIFDTHTANAKERSLVILLEIKSTKKGGRGLIAAIVVDGYAHLNGKRITANAITTIHERDKAVNMLRKAVEAEEKHGAGLYYWEKQRALNILNLNRKQNIKKGDRSYAVKRGRVQSPAGQNLPSGLIHTLDEPGQKVNTLYKNATESLQCKRWAGMIMTDIM